MSGILCPPADACIVEQLPGVDALLARDAEGTRYELYLVELTVGNARRA